MALRGEGFHAVPPPSSLTGQHEHALHGPPHEHALHGPPHEHALHEPPHGHVPHDALVPAHDSLVPAENRPQWVNLPPGEVGHGEMCGRVHEIQPSPADSFKTPQSMTSNVADFLGGELTADEATRAVRSFQNAVELKLSQLGPGDTISSRTLIEALALSWRLAEVCHGECSLK